MSDKPVKISKLRKQILDAKGLERAHAEPGEHHELSPIQLDYHLTPLMRVKELEFGEVIHSLISKKRGTIYQVGKRLGVHPSTVYLWRKRLDIL